MYQNVTAIVLSARRAKEKDKRLGLYTQEYGRLSATAVGAARPGAKLGAATEPAVESKFRLWREGDAPFARVTGGGVEQSFPALRTQWRRMGAAQFLCEWTERLTPFAEAHPEKYELLRRSLAALETAGDLEAVKLAFQTRFLALAGYNPVRDVPGLSAVSGAAALFTLWAEDDPAAPAVLPPALPAPYLQQQLLKFVSPLLTGPLRSGLHEENLRQFREKSAP